jgi:hypothetical protein
VFTAGLSSPLLDYNLGLCLKQAFPHHFETIIGAVVKKSRPLKPHNFWDTSGSGSPCLFSPFLDYDLVPDKKAFPRHF